MIQKFFTISKTLASIVALFSVSSMFASLLPFSILKQKILFECRATQTLQNAHFLARVVSEPEENKIHDFFLKTNNQNEITQVIRKTTDTLQEISIKNLQESQVVLARASNKDALILSCSGCSIRDGGTVKFTYLYDGMLDEYRDYHMLLSKNQENAWKLFSKERRSEIIRHAKIVSNYFLGILIGIKEILINSEN